MPAIHILGANKINADTAGKTASAQDMEPAGAPVGPSVSEIVHVGGLDLGDMFAGGSHPEHLVQYVATPLEVATDSVTGRLGGLVPRIGSVLQPGPAGGAATTRSIVGARLSKVADQFRKKV